MIKEKIKQKLSITITILIFLLVVIKEFVLLYQSPEDASKIFIAFSFIVALYLIIYGLFYLFERNLFKNNITFLIDYLLTMNFFVVGIQIIYLLFSTNGRSITNLVLMVLHKVFGYTLVALVIIPIIIFILFICFVSNPKNKVNNL